MPVEYIFENENRGLYAKFTGTISNAEVINALDEIIATDTEYKLKYRIQDLTQAEKLELDEYGLNILAKKNAEISSNYTSQHIALVGDEYLFGGRDRVFTIFIEIWTNFTCKLFPTVTDAREWIASQLPEIPGIK